MRKFEKVKYEEFQKYYGNADKLYSDLKLPERATKGSAGYDIYAVEPVVLKAHSAIAIPTGIKASLNQDEVLLIVIRSSLGFKKNIRLINQLGVIDSDYYSNPDNDGHILVKLYNHSDEDFVLDKGKAFAQGIFIKYLTVDNESENLKIRKGGIGSTDGGEKWKNII